MGALDENSTSTLTFHLGPPGWLERQWQRNSCIISSVRSSNSHPDLLLTHHHPTPPHFFRSHRSSTLDFHFLSQYSYIKAMMLYKGKTWQDSGILWHTLAYSGIHWHTLAYIGILWHTLVYSCILWHTLPYFGMLLHTLASSDIHRHTVACSDILL